MADLSSKREMKIREQKPWKQEHWF
jgi:hypothetical protein